jgi:hypothetical protein
MGPLVLQSLWGPLSVSVMPWLKLNCLVLHFLHVLSVDENNLMSHKYLVKFTVIEWQTQDV